MVIVMRPSGGVFGAYLNCLGLILASLVYYRVSVTF